MENQLVNISRTFFVNDIESYLPYLAIFFLGAPIMFTCVMCKILKVTPVVLWRIIKCILLPCNLCIRKKENKPDIVEVKADNKFNKKVDEKHQKLLAP